MTRTLLVVLSAAAFFLSAALLPCTVHAQCPAKPPLALYTPGPNTPCNCFIPGEEVGVTFTPAAADYPLEVLSVSFYWRSVLGGAPAIQEQGVHLYNAGLPNPGPRIATIPAPILIDGVLNNHPFPGPVPVAGGPITATLEFINQTSAGAPVAPDVVWDSDGCQPGINLVKTIPGGWSDACALGVTGDWVVELVYRPCQTPVPVERTTWGSVKRILSGTPSGKH